MNTVAKLEVSRLCNPQRYQYIIFKNRNEAGIFLNLRKIST